MKLQVRKNGHIHLYSVTNLLQGHKLRMLFYYLGYEVRRLR